MKSNFTQTQCGTPYFMSPEVWLNLPYDSKSDVWALGCLLHQMMTFKPPFDGKDLAALGRRVVYSTLPSLRGPHTQHKYSQALTDLATWLLNKEAAKRPTAREILMYPPLQEKMHLVKSASAGEADDNPQFSLLNTIKVPPNLQKMSLPASDYKAAGFPSNGPVSGRAQSRQSVSNPPVAPSQRAPAPGAAFPSIPKQSAPQQQQQQYQQQQQQQQQQRYGAAPAPAPAKPTHQQHQQQQQQQQQYSQQQYQQAGVRKPQPQYGYHHAQPQQAARGRGYGQDVLVL
jgi:NIMA (never in mitosis gene a)-related kinase